jgi:hypothetical protein
MSQTYWNEQKSTFAVSDQLTFYHHFLRKYIDYSSSSQVLKFLRNHDFLSIIKWFLVGQPYAFCHLSAAICRLLSAICRLLSAICLLQSVHSFCIPHLTFFPFNLETSPFQIKVFWTYFQFHCFWDHHGEFCRIPPYKFLAAFHF